MSGFTVLLVSLRWKKLQNKSEQGDKHDTR